MVRIMGVSKCRCKRLVRTVGRTDGFSVSACLVIHRLRVRGIDRGDSVD